ncbi:MAG: hypothetical protein ACJ8J0_12800, partial [Longimicrobiaceae bacterium]
MHADQQPYRELYDDILEYGGDALYAELLHPWLARNGGERRWLDELRGRRGAPVPAMQPEESCRLYALSRIVQLLQLSFAPRAPEPTWNLATVSEDDYARFMDALGLEQVEHAAFHPFFHEVVTVDPLAEDDAAPEVAGVYWAGYALGPLLLSRAGCRVRAGRAHLVKEVAERSTLYWAYARGTRDTDDLSRGWGGSSQWRTPFRRDYALGGRLYYNVDGREHPGGAGHDLDARERDELLCATAASSPAPARATTSGPTASAPSRTREIAARTP